MADPEPPTDNRAEPTPREKYESLRPRYVELAEFVAAAIQHECEQLGVDCFYEHRAKDVEKFLAKAQRPDKTYSDPLAEITDLAGIRVIVTSKAAMPSVVDRINARFNIDPNHSGNKADERSFDQFGYDAGHYVGTLKGDDLTDDLEGLLFEIQVRSVLQDAWARVSRGHFYQTDSVSNGLRRRLHALAAVLELADKEFDEVRAEADRLVGAAGEQIRQDAASVPINPESVTAYLQQSPMVERWAEQTRSLGVQMGMNIGDVGRTVAMLERCDMHTVDDIDALFAGAESWGEGFLERYWKLFQFNYGRDHGRAPEGLSSNREGIISLFVTATYPHLLTPATMEAEFGWGGANMIHDARGETMLEISHDGTYGVQGSQDILGYRNGDAGRFHRFTVAAKGQPIIVSITMSGTADSIFENRGLDPDEWIAQHGPEVIRLRPEVLEEGADRTIMLSWGEIEALGVE